MFKVTLLLWLVLRISKISAIGSNIFLLSCLCHALKV